ITNFGNRALGELRIPDNAQAGGGGRNTTSCLADSATTSFGVCSAMLWIAQNKSYRRRVGETQKKHFTGWSDLLKMPWAIPIGSRIRSPAVAAKSLPSSTRSKRPSNM